MNLSENFTLEEFTVSDTAARHGLDNTPSQIAQTELFRTAALMEQVRALLCKPIQITSGYRCSALNKLVGSKPNSSHVSGLACDFKVPSYGNPLQVCQEIKCSDIIFGKLILEYYTPSGSGWVHIQVGSDKKILTMNNHGTFTGLVV